MSNANQRRLRVAVQLTRSIAVAADDVQNNNNIETPPTSPAVDSSTPSPLMLYQSLQVWDSQTLNIHTKHGLSVKQRFDYVSHAANDKLNLQVCLMLDKLVLRRQNCCLLFFDAQRDVSNLIYLFKLLITEFNKRLEQLETSICKIHLMYLKSEGNAEQDQNETVLVPTTFRRHFENTLDLLKWLLNFYRLACSAITVYESLEINFCIKKSSMDGDEIFDVKLTLVNVYFTKMDDRTRTQLFSYVLVPEQHSEPFQHTAMTSLLRDALEMEPKTSKLLLCNIPPEMQSWKAEAFLLTVVIKLYERFGRESSLLIRKRSFPSSSDTVNSLSSANSNESTATVALAKPRSICFSIPFNENGSKKSKTTTQKAYSNEYLNKLRTWYNKLDDGFAEAHKLMEHYYAAKYDSKMMLISRDIKLLSQNIDMIDSNQELEPSQAVPNECDSCETLCTEYKTKLQQLSSEVEDSIYAEDIKVYLCTKQFAHSQQIINFKLQQLQSCKQRLTNVFNEEINALICLLYAEEI